MEASVGDVFDVGDTGFKASCRRAKVGESGDFELELELTASIDCGTLAAAGFGDFAFFFLRFGDSSTTWLGTPSTTIFGAPLILAEAVIAAMTSISPLTTMPDSHS